LQRRSLQWLTNCAFIPVGNNRSTGANGYFAKQGYDLCTGWGSPNGVQLLQQLATWLAAQNKSAAPAMSVAAR
jgi:hypothetical protein